MSTARYGSSHVVLSGRLYVMGGWGDNKSVEYYEPATNKWQTAAPMNHSLCSRRFEWVYICPWRFQRTWCSTVC